MTPFENKVLEAIKALTKGGKPVRQAAIAKHLRCHNGLIWQSLQKLGERGLIRKSRVYQKPGHGNNSPWISEYTLPVKATDTKGVTICPPGYAAGYGWETHPEDPKWRS